MENFLTNHMGLDTAGTRSIGDPTSQDLINYFIKEADAIRNSTASTAATSTRLPPATAAFDRTFQNIRHGGCL